MSDKKSNVNKTPNKTTARELEKEVKKKADQSAHIERNSKDQREEKATESKAPNDKEVEELQDSQTMEDELLGEDVFNEEDVKKTIFSKKDKKDKKDIKIEELEDRLKRNMAEFENFRKRTEKEKSQMYEIGARSIIEKILPTIDNFERGINSIAEEERDNSFVQGFDMIYKQFMSTLDGIGVKPIESLDKPFDLNYHNAVMHVEDDTKEENIVIEEFQKGYTYKDTVIRHSMVKVAN